MDRLRRTALVVFALTLAASLVAAGAAFAEGARRLAILDFIALHAAARLVWLGRGADVLDADAVLAMERELAPERVALLPYVHPPAVALLLGPLGALDLPAAYAVMVASGALALAAAAWLLRPLASSDRPVLFALALLAPSSAMALVQGQTTPFVLLAIAASLRTPPFASGVLLGLTALRPQTAPLFLLAGVDGRRRALGVATGVGAVVLTSAAVVGMEGLARYALLLVGAAGWTVTGELGLSRAIGWTGAAHALGLVPLGLIALAASAVAGLVAVARAGGLARRLALAGPWSLLASPHALIHDAPVVYPAIAARATTRAGLAAWSAAGVAIAIVHLAGVPIVPLYLVALGLSVWLRR